MKLESKLFLGRESLLFKSCFTSLLLPRYFFLASKLLKQIECRSQKFSFWNYNLLNFDQRRKNLISKEGFLHMQQCNTQRWVYFIYLVEAKNKSYIRYLDVTLAYETTIDFFGKLRAFLKIDMFYWYLY